MTQPTDPKEEACEVCGRPMYSPAAVKAAKGRRVEWCYGTGEEHWRLGYERLLKERRPAASALPSVDLGALEKLEKAATGAPWSVSNGQDNLVVQGEYISTHIALCSTYERSPRGLLRVSRTNQDSFAASVRRQRWMDARHAGLGAAEIMRTKSTT